MAAQTSFLNKIMDIPNSRKSDPASSKAAGNIVNKKTRQSNTKFVLEIMQRRAHRHAMTSRELFYSYRIHFKRKGIDKYEVARRMSDLKRMKLIEFCAMRSCVYAKKHLSTYRAVEKWKDVDVDGKIKTTSFFSK